MTTSQILSKAAEMDVDPKWALNCRKRYLAGEIFKRQLDFEYWIYREDDDFINDYMFAIFAIREIEAMAKLKIEMRRVDNALLRKHGTGITDEQIEAARSYPINQLVKFQHGKAIAPCHDDRHPSLYHGTRTNRACCPVCNKSWGPIDWLMEWEGRTFVEAVGELGR